jgi:uncharacterized membrane protein
MEVNKMNTRVRTKDLVETSLLIALVFVATYCVQFHLPIGGEGGLVHLGTSMLFISSIVFGKKKGAISGAFGMGIFDLVSGYAVWAPFTFIIRGIMGYIMGSITWSKNRRGNNVIINIVASILSGIWMIAGYYFSQVIIYGNWVTPFLSIPGDAIQIVFALAIGIPTAKLLKTYIK